ncbi:hypothetical protein MJO28_013820 [Puccinia striiformis f. sp. tritici]|uniref:Uncharacterized protein n=1 Tax=Puccinia striiformis f. sp. tritici TaxID=168172 RepID=A0ACC0DWY1_9BASI|nr:hypothetical protein MJO28_013820 [Puccinia striiformis f. sp. tritici]
MDQRNLPGEAGPSGSSSPRPPTFRYSEILIPIEDLLDTLPELQRVYIKKFYDNLDRDISMLKYGPTPENQKPVSEPTYHRLQEYERAVTQFSKIYPARFDAFQAELDDTYSDLNLHSGVYSRRAEGLDDLLSRLGKTELSKLISMNTNGADEIPKCTICWAEYLHADRITTLPCHEKHHFHESCIEEWMLEQPFCPLCLNRTKLPRVHKQTT